MRKRWLAVLVSAVVLASSVRADEQPANLLTNGDAETGTLDGWTGFTEVTTENPHSGKFCFSAEGAAEVQSRDFIPVDPDKTYTITVWVRSSGKELSRVYVGYAPYDAEKKPITHINVDALPGTETTLVEGCKESDKILKIADGSKWQAGEWNCAAFQVDDSGKYADLPNRNLSSCNILRIEKKGEYWQVQLHDACGRAYPAGTKVRVHSTGLSSIYNALVGDPLVPKEWTKYTGKIRGVVLTGCPMDHWWHGTKYVHVLLLLNSGQVSSVSAAVDDISVTVSP